MRITKLIALPAVAVGLIMGAPTAAQASETVTVCVQFGAPCPPQTCDVNTQVGSQIDDGSGTTTYLDSESLCIMSDTYRASGADALIGDVLTTLDDLVP